MSGTICMRVYLHVCFWFLLYADSSFCGQVDWEAHGNQTRGEILMLQTMDWYRGLLVLVPEFSAYTGGTKHQMMQRSNGGCSCKNLPCDRDWLACYNFLPTFGGIVRFQVHFVLNYYLSTIFRMAKVSCISKVGSFAML